MQRCTIDVKLYPSMLGNLGAGRGPRTAHAGEAPAGKPACNPNTAFKRKVRPRGLLWRLHGHSFAEKPTTQVLTLP